MQYLSFVINVTINHDSSLALSIIPETPSVEEMKVKEDYNRWYVKRAVVITIHD